MKIFMATEFDQSITVRITDEESGSHIRLKGELCHDHGCKLDEGEEDRLIEWMAEL